jgi:hypothetical protein
MNGFEDFWRQFPRKVGKLAAKREWDRLKPDAETRQQMEATLSWQVEQWDDPKYTPHPTTWLHQGRWLDEPPTTRARTAAEKVVDANAAVVQQLRRVK